MNRRGQKFLVLYSYNTPIAFQPYEDGQKGIADAVFITDSKYSVTTSGHVRSLIAAARHRRRIQVPGAARNVWAESWISQTLDKQGLANLLRGELESRQEYALQHPRRRSLASVLTDSLETAQRVMREVHGEQAVRLLRFKLTPVTKENAAVFARRQAARNAALERTRLRQHVEAQRQDAAELAEKLPLWRKGERNVRLPAHRSAYLRLSGDGTEVETSHGASLNLDLALAFYRRLQRRAVEPGQHVGPFAISQVGEQTLTIGCHFIQRAEIDALAAEVLEAPSAIA